MSVSGIKLPSNKKFGFFFTFLFFLAAFYFNFNTQGILDYVFATGAAALFITTLIKAEILLPLNKLWMRFGLMLGLIVSPFVFGIIFFVLFTPIALMMRLIGRDELRLNCKSSSSYWISRHEPNQLGSLKNQF